MFAGNLIDRLYDPQQFLEQIKSRINDNGILVITSPYTWLETFSEKRAGADDSVSALCRLVVRHEIYDVTDLSSPPIDKDDSSALKELQTSVERAQGTRGL